jgi:hypothetical protein
MHLRKDQVGGVVLYRIERQAPYAAWGPEFISVQLEPAHSIRWLVRPTASVPIVNPLRSAQVVTLRARLSRLGPTVPIRIDYPDGSAEELRVGGQGVTLNHRLTLAPGAHALRLTVHGPKYLARPDPRSHYLDVTDFQLSPRG